MSVRRAVALITLAGGLALGVAGCGGDDSGGAVAPNPGGPAAGEAPQDPNCPPPDIATIDPAVLKVEAGPVEPLVSGKPANFEITVTNTADTDIPLVFSSSQQADVLLSKDGEQVYDWSSNRVFAEVIRCQTLAPGEVFTVQLAETNPLDVPPGEYVLTARDGDRSVPSRLHIAGDSGLARQQPGELDAPVRDH